MGYVNGTRYSVEKMSAEILFSNLCLHQRKVLALQRMSCSVPADDFAIPGFRRLEFPVRVCFAMIINKAQRQSLNGTLGLDSTSLCFYHGQLYVGLSRKTNLSKISFSPEITLRKRRTSCILKYSVNILD